MHKRPLSHQNSDKQVVIFSHKFVNNLPKYIYISQFQLILDFNFLAFSTANQNTEPACQTGILTSLTSQALKISMFQSLKISILSSQIATFAMFLVFNFAFILKFLRAMNRFFQSMFFILRSNKPDDALGLSQSDGFDSSKSRIR